MTALTGYSNISHRNEHFLNHTPQNLIFRYLQNRSRVSVWLYENVNMRIEGHIIGFDEYMNLVLEESEEVNEKHKTRKQIGAYCGGRG